MIYILLVCDLAREILGGLANPFLSLPAAFQGRQEHESFFKAWEYAANFRWKQREVARDHRLGIYGPEKLEGSMAYWATMARGHKVILSLQEIDRIKEENPGYDASGFANWLLPLFAYSDKEWKRQRPWHYRWVMLKRRLRP